MSPIPPGLPHALRYLSATAIPLAIVYTATYIVERSFGLSLPTWIYAGLSVISLPLFVAGRICYGSWRKQRAAARLGATFPPSWNGKLIGNYDLLVKFREIYKNGYLGDGLTEAHQEFGPTICLSVLWDPLICTIDSDTIKIILATDFGNFVKGDDFQAYMYSVLGTGVFNADGDLWKFHRSMTRPFFSRDRISHFDLFERHSDEAIIRMRDRFSEGYAVDFQDLISRFTLDSASEFLFGSCVNSLEAKLPYPPQSSIAAQQQKDASPADKFAAAFSRAQETIASRGRLGFTWPFLELFSSKTSEDMQVVDDFLDPILQAALDKSKRDKATGLWKESSTEEIDDNETLLDHLVKYTADPQVLHDEILNILIAGRDTTAGTLTFAVYFLSMYPHILERLRKEILETVGASRRPDYDDIKNMKYLRAFLNETLRLYPAVPFNIRVAVKDTTIPNPDPNGLPFFVPAGTPVNYSVMIMHRRTDYWGPDAHKFDPDRFLDDRLQYLVANPFIFLPFNAGPRICLGQQFAYNEMSFFLIRLLQNFSTINLELDCQDPSTRPPPEWSEASGRKGEEKFFPKSHLTAYANGGLWVKMKEVDASETV